MNVHDASKDSLRIDSIGRDLVTFVRHGNLIMVKHLIPHTDSYWLTQAIRKAKIFNRRDVYNTLQEAGAEITPYHRRDQRIRRERKTLTNAEKHSHE